MGRKRRGKNREHIDSSPEADEPGKSSTCNPDVEWETCTEQQLEETIRKKLNDLYRDALSRLVSMLLDEDVALESLLERGYCIGMGDCLTNVVLNSLGFLSGVVDVVDSEEKKEKEEEKKEETDEEEDEPPPQPFLNLELLVEFNLQFMVYILQKYRPSLNRISACSCILMNDLNLNRAILMDLNGTPSVTNEFLSNLNLGGGGCDNVDKDRFLALEIREILNNLNVLDESISEDTKDMMIANSQTMIDDLEEQLQERIRWATKKLAQARTKQTAPRMNLMAQIQLFHEYSQCMLSNKKSELSSINNELDNIEKAFDDLERQKKAIQAEISASKLMGLETEKQRLEFSKCEKKNKPLLRNREKQKVKLEEEMAMEKQKISKWEQQLVEIEADLIQTDLKLGEIMKAREVATAELDKEKNMSMERWKIMKPMVDAVQSQAYKNLHNSMNELLKLAPKKELRESLSFFSRLLSILSKNTQS